MSTDSPFPLVEAERCHRAHAIVEQVFANLEDSALGHLPSGKFTANAAWLTPPALAHNLTRALGTLVFVFHAKARTGTIRRQPIAVPARLAVSARTLTFPIEDVVGETPARSEQAPHCLPARGSGRAPQDPPGHARTVSWPSSQHWKPTTARLQHCRGTRPVAALPYPGQRRWRAEAAPLLPSLPRGATPCPRGRLQHTVWPARK
ncbi:hypothetical protein GCM10022206_25050 [Streptomyces chiangmaiensis]